MRTDLYRWSAVLRLASAALIFLLPSTAAQPILVSLSPSSSGGQMQDFTVTVADAMGAFDVAYVELLIHMSSDGEDACRIYFDNVLEQIDPDRSDGHCSAVLVSAGASGENVRFSVRVVFHSNRRGERTLWVAAGDLADNNTDYRLVGTVSGIGASGEDSGSTGYRERRPSGVLPRFHRAVLRWNASTTPEVTYDVYRASSSGGPYLKINSATITTTTYTDVSVSGGQTYYYVVTAVTAGGTQSIYSNEAPAAIPSN